MSKRRKKILTWTISIITLLSIIGAYGIYWLWEIMRTETANREKEIIAYWTADCLLENKIKSPQSERQMAQMIYCGNPKGIDYLWFYKDLELSGNDVIRNKFFNINFHVQFDGTSIIVKSSDSDNPYSVGIANFSLIKKK